jgi:hypothetical protein
MSTATFPPVTNPAKRVVYSKRGKRRLIKVYLLGLVTILVPEALVAAVVLWPPSSTVTGNPLPVVNFGPAPMAAIPPPLPAPLPIPVPAPTAPLPCRPPFRNRRPPGPGCRSRSRPRARCGCPVAAPPS